MALVVCMVESSDSAPNRWGLFLVAAFWMVLGAHQSLASEDHVIIEDLDRTVRLVQKDIGAPGLSVSIATDRGILFSRAYGSADLERGKIVARTTRFRTGSVAKAFTGTLLARLVQSGSIDLGESIADIDPLLQGVAPGITPRMLAGHLAGIRNYQDKDADIDNQHFGSPAEILSIFVDDPLISKPGTEHHYSTFGFSLLSAAIELKLNETYLDLLTREVLNPLQLDHTTGDIAGVNSIDRTVFYKRSVDGQFEVEADLDPSYKYSGGGLLSTADDLVRLGLGILSNDFLAAPARKIIATPQMTSGGKPIRESLGWRLGEDLVGRPVIHHAGSMAGARAVLVVYPEDHLAVALMSNLGVNPYFAETTAQFFAQKYLDRGDGSGISERTKELDGLESTYSYTGEFMGESVEGEFIIGANNQGATGFMETPAALNAVAKSNGFKAVDKLTILGSSVRDHQVTLFLSSQFGIIDLALDRDAGALTAQKKQNWFDLKITISPVN